MDIIGGTLITGRGPLDADLAIADGRISDIRPRTTHDAKATDGTVDATGLWVLPGAVDAHTHFGMPLGQGISSLGWRDSSQAALLGGTTTIIDFANPEPGQSLTEAVDQWQARADADVLCDYGLHVTVTDTSADRLAEIPALVARGLPTFKGFLAYKDRLMLTPTQMSALMTTVQTCGGMVLVHAEDGLLNEAAEQVLLNTGRTGPRWHPLAHPAESEIQAVTQVLDLALAADCPLTIVHISLAESLKKLCEARNNRPRSGQTTPLYGEVCLHHLWADARTYEAGHEAALAAVLSPPLRTEADTRFLADGLAAGDLDLLSTDHCEFPLKLKAQLSAGGFPCIPNGAGGVGERLVISYSQSVATGLMSRERWVQACCERPAEIMGLDGRKGRLEVGYDADIVLFDPEPDYRWHPLGQSDPSVSLWAGLPCQGQVKYVWLRGQPVVQNGRLVSPEPGGQFLPRHLKRTP